MNDNGEFGLLLSALWADLHDINVVWQIGVLLVCLGLAWVFAWLLRRHQANAKPAATRVAQIGKRGLKRVAFPLVAALLILVARPLLAHWHSVNLLSVAVPLMLSLALIRSVFFVLRLSFSGPWLESFERTFAVITWLVVVLHITGLLPELIELLDGIGFGTGKQRLTLWLILEGAAMVLATLLLALWISSAIENRLMAASGLNSNLRIVFARLVKAALIVIAVLIALPVVGIDPTALSVFGGALGVGLGFGLQKIAANYVSGFIILLDRSIRIGNIISVGSERGQVTRITTRYTVLKGGSGVESIVPNEVLVGSVVQNESFSDSRIRVALPAQVAYGADLEQAMALMVKTARQQPRVLAEPAAQAFVMAFADSGINLELGFWVADPHKGLQQLRSDINLGIWQAFKTAGIEIPFPQREVRLVK
ncbi:MAG: mechanosensitive ion channel [Zoogloeaceae bacterium]|nr:mechanosensitive ion channel [Zoogloeaceae bacterium]